MSSAYSTCVGRKRGKGASAGVGMGSQKRQLTLSKGSADTGIRSLVQGAAIPSKDLFLPHN
jgi:hypothetical protein